MARWAVTTKADLSSRVFAAGLDLFLDSFINFLPDHPGLAALPASHQLWRVSGCVKKQGFICQRKIQRKEILHTRKKPPPQIFFRNVMAALAHTLSHAAQ